MSPMALPMAAHFISCREVRRYKFHQHLDTENTLSSKAVLSYKHRCWLDIRHHCGYELAERKGDLERLETLPISKARRPGNS